MGKVLSDTLYDFLYQGNEFLADLFGVFQNLFMCGAAAIIHIRTVVRDAANGEELYIEMCFSRNLLFGCSRVREDNRSRHASIVPTYRL